MNILITDFIKSNKWPLLFMALALVGGFVAFPLTFVSSTNVLLGFALFPFVIIVNGTKRTNFIYLAVCIFFAIISWKYHVRMFYFLALSFYLLYIIELFAGKLNYLILFLVVFMSPIFEQAAGILGFPIRLLLSSWAGYLLSAAGFSIKVSGNLIALNNSAFTIDAACMGLNMLAVSFMMGVFLLAYQSKNQKSGLSILKLTGFFLVVFGLNLLSNLLRIITLIVFKILPENPFHELVGIMGLCLYVMVPIYFFSIWIIKKHGSPLVPQSKSEEFSGYKNLLISSVMALFMLGAGIYIGQNKNKTPIEHAQVSMGNMQTIKMDEGITKMLNDQILVYVKPIPEFFTGEHSPLFCWKGTGYEFKGIKKITIGGNEIYVGELAKPDSRLYTAWWYSNGKTQTINQMDWRLRMLQGENKFCLINVTSNKDEILLKNLDSIFNGGVLKLKI